MITPEMEAMAVAVIKGDEAAAHALADAVHERLNAARLQIPPITKLEVGADNLRVALYLDPVVLQSPFELDAEAVRSDVDSWLRNGSPLILVGFNRIEVFQLPESK